MCLFVQQQQQWQRPFLLPLAPKQCVSSIVPTGFVRLPRPALHHCSSVVKVGCLCHLSGKVLNSLLRTRVCLQLPVVWCAANAWYMLRHATVVSR